MKWILLTVCFLLCCAIRAQSVRFKELKSKPIPEFYNTTDSTIVFPIVITTNPGISRSINKSIEYALLESDLDDSARTTRVKLRRMIKSGLTDLGYEVTYNKDDLLSLDIYMVVEAAYPNPSRTYLNFDIRTGQTLTIRDIVADSLFKQFQEKVFADKMDSLKVYKEKDLKGLFSSKQIDSSTYEWALEEIDSNCVKGSDIESFFLSKTGIEIIEPCEFPHAIRGISPSFKLEYSYPFMYPYLRSEFRNRLIQ
jgi:hypothetical protein